WIGLVIASFLRQPLSLDGFPTSRLSTVQVDQGSCFWARWLDWRPKRMCLHPQGRSGSERIKTKLAPPCGFIGAAVSLAMVDPAERNRELVADLAPQRRMLGKTEVMGVSRLAPTNEAWLLAD